MSLPATFGTLPLTLILGLTEARDKAHDILSQVAKGDDPAPRRAKPGQQRSIRSAPSQRATCASEQRTFDRPLCTVERSNASSCLNFRDKPIGEIRRSNIASLLDAIVEENGEVMADLTLAIVRRVFTWHAARDDHFVSPLTKGMARSKPSERARSRILNDDELRAVWTAASQPDDLFGAYVRFLLLTAARRDEAAEMSRIEIKDGVWTIPAARYKTGVDTDLPLSAAGARGAREPAPHWRGQVRLHARRRAAFPGAFERQSQARQGVWILRLGDPRSSAHSTLADVESWRFLRHRRAMPRSQASGRSGRLRSPSVPRGEKARLRGRWPPSSSA